MVSTEHNLTEKERNLIRDICTDDYNSKCSCEGMPWSWSVVNGSKARAGVLSSLTKKGLVWTQGAGRDAVCGFTDEGKRIARELWPSEAC